MTGSRGDRRWRRQGGVAAAGWEQHLGGVAGRYYLRYFGDAEPGDWALDLPRDELTTPMDGGVGDADRA